MTVDRMPPFLRPSWDTLPPTVGAISTERAGGVSETPFDDGSGSGHGGLNLGMHCGDVPERVMQNRSRLRAVLPAEPAWLRQVHGTAVVDAGRLPLDSVPEADASFTDRPGVVCAILTADCLPVLFTDRAGRVVGAAHAGWRGLAAGVLQNTAAAMRAAGAGELLAWLGPAIGPQRFEVGSDVVTAFVDRDARAVTAFRPIAGRAGKFLADIDALARLALDASGIACIAGGGACTVSEPARYYSYRRDGQTGRMATLIWIR